MENRKINYFRLSIGFVIVFFGIFPCSNVHRKIRSFYLHSIQTERSQMVNFFHSIRYVSHSFRLKAAFDFHYTSIVIGIFLALTKVALGMVLLSFVTLLLRVCRHAFSVTNDEVYFCLANIFDAKLTSYATEK